MKYLRYYKLGKSYRLTDLEIRQMKKLKAKGWTNIKLAKKFEVSPAGVRYHCNPDAHEYYLKRLMEKTKKESKLEKNLRNKRDYYRKMELFPIEYREYLYTSKKNQPSYPHSYKYYIAKYKEVLSLKERKILEQYFKIIKPKLKSYGK